MRPTELQSLPARLSEGRFVMGRAMLCFRVHPFLAEPRETPGEIVFVERGMVGGYMLALSLPAIVATWVLAYPVHTAITGGWRLPFWPIGGALAAIFALAVLVVGYARWRRRSLRIDTRSGGVHLAVRTLGTRSGWAFAPHETRLLLHPVSDYALQRRGPRRYTAALLWTPAGPICLGFDRDDEKVRTWLRNAPLRLAALASGNGAPITTYSVFGGCIRIGADATDD